MVVNTKNSDQKYKDKRKNRDYERKLQLKQKNFQRTTETTSEESEDELPTSRQTGKILAPIEIDFEEENLKHAHKKKSNMIVIDNKSAGQDLPRKWRPEDNEVDYSDDDDDDEGLVRFNVPSHPKTIQDLLEDESVQTIFDHKSISYMSAKEKHAARQARKKAREALEALQATSDEQNKQPTEHLLKTPSLAPKEESMVDKIHRLFLKTVQFDDITTAKMSKVISNLSYFGYKDKDFFLPIGKRSAPAPAKSAFYFYQTAARKASKKPLKKDNLLKAWRELELADKEYYLRQAELDHIRYMIQNSQYADIVAKQNDLKATKSQKMERKLSGKHKHNDEDSGEEVVAPSLASRRNSTSSNKSISNQESDEEDESELFTNTEFNKYPQAQQFSFAEGIEDDMEALSI